MESWAKSIQEIESAEYFPELIEALVKKIFLSYEEAFQILKKQCIDAAEKFAETVEAGDGMFRSFAEKGMSLQEVDEHLHLSEKVYDPDIDLSPRKYGERLSWGKRGRPYKFSSSVLILPFKRNLPYQRRIF